MCWIFLVCFELRFKLLVKSLKRGGGADAKTNSCLLYLSYPPPLPILATTHPQVLCMLYEDEN